MSRKKRRTGKRQLWFKALKCFLKLFIKKPRWIFLDGEFTDKCIILSNHDGANGPLVNELYLNKPFRFWGTYEMNMGLGEVYKYLSVIYFHQKKHWKKLPAKLFSIIAAPFAFLFYRGLKLIPTYRDYRLKGTFEESMEALDEGMSLIIFPEDSHDGYHEELRKFFPGFLVFAYRNLKRGEDLPIYLCYLNKKERRYVVDKPVMTSELFNSGKTKDEISEEMRNRCNELGKMKIPSKKE